MKKNIFIAATIIVLTTLYSCEDLLNDPSSKEITQKLEGQWKCEETSSIFKSTQDFYYVYITPSPDDSTTIFISNFYDLGSDIETTAQVSGYDLTIPNQTLPGDFKVWGSGKISSSLKEISLTYFVDDGSGQEDKVEAVYSLQY
jgi:hypothetical protein